jgi:aspartyl-tRNA(Asn)/glutamyl-tRNA(Gln) amidotransferase subunit B
LAVNIKKVQIGIIKDQMLKNKPTIGLEIHVELATASKMFCACRADHFGKKPNSQTCPVCLGLPGALPVPNRKAVEWTILIGLALNSRINLQSKFDRKHYNYPDLPKGYQISQYDKPICSGGYMDTSEGLVKINRIHLEEDTGKLQHKKVNGRDVSLIDFNRSGVPLVEIVTEPDISSGTQAKEFAQKLQNLIRFLGVSGCDMEKGSMRLEANTSWGLHLGYKVEVKNLNSFKFIDRAIVYDLERQKDLLNKGITPKQETRGWDEKKNITVSQRYKETSADYRYFPEPDIPPMRFSESFIGSVKSKIPKMPSDYYETLTKKYKVRSEFADILSADKETAEYAIAAMNAAGNKIAPDKIADLIVNKKADVKKQKPQKLISTLLKAREDVTSDEKEIRVWVDEAIENLPKAVSDYKAGNKNAVSALVGAVMKTSGGKADPSKAREILEELLG